MRDQTTSVCDKYVFTKNKARIKFKILLQCLLKMKFIFDFNWIMTIRPYVYRAFTVQF